MKLFHGIVFSNRDIGSNNKPFLPFQVHGNDAVMERSLLPNFQAWISYFTAKQLTTPSEYLTQPGAGLAALTRENR